MIHAFQKHYSYKGCHIQSKVVSTSRWKIVKTKDKVGINTLYLGPFYDVSVGDGKEKQSSQV